MYEESKLINNSPTNMEHKKAGDQVTPSFAEKYLPHLDLANPKETERKLISVLSGLKDAQEQYNNLEIDADQEELQEAYDAYIKRLAELLPPGYLLKEVTIPRSAERWRGTEPVLIMSLLADRNNKLKIDSDFPNVARKWETSVSYGQSKLTKKELPLVLALGFKMPQDFKLKKAELSPLYKDTIETASGTINFDDAKELVIRFNGKQKGKIYPPKFYKIIPPSEAMAA